jgi:hypothetical protein
MVKKYLKKRYRKSFKKRSRIGYKSKYGRKRYKGGKSRYKKGRQLERLATSALPSKKVFSAKVNYAMGTPFVEGIYNGSVFAGSDIVEMSEQAAGVNRVVNARPIGIQNSKLFTAISKLYPVKVLKAQ